ncbi:hypothetical protein [Streptomyces sp. 1331.2]|uniref:hypothetical protein n=1 Tax=Streptomyces sp. 1331.2 TaxID=1938835 RepID=UPI000BD78FF8|nr:hypothetical protein [Streptomyces sp. 1331.2]SOB81374.1 hypothetical protein SAMN06272789_1506 [Streptomyces sp. 1331.2]
MRDQHFIPRSLRDEIRRHVVGYQVSRLAHLAKESMDEDGKAPLAIKYTSAMYARGYRNGMGRLQISATPGFTWGDATYVTPLAFPISSAIFGRVGVVAGFDPEYWLVYDATERLPQELYMAWVGFQPRRNQLLLTCHSQLANQFMRNLFRTAFQIDCVLFRPDQRNRWYSGPNDVWMAVSDWDGNRELVKEGGSSCFSHERIAVIVEEEFKEVHHDLRRNALIGPISRREPDRDLMLKIRGAYARGEYVHLYA